MTPDLHPKSNIMKFHHKEKVRLPPREVMTFVCPKCGEVVRAKVQRLSVKKIVRVHCSKWHLWDVEV